MTPPDPRPPTQVPEGGGEQLQPFEVDPVPVVAGGTAVWFLAFLVLLALRDRLVGAGHGEWVWTALAGAGLGLVGTAWCLRRRARLGGRDDGGEEAGR